MFSPTLGRWIQNDPIEFEAGDPNLYRFVRNNPTNRVDPSGLAGEKPLPCPDKLGQIGDAIDNIQLGDFGLLNERSVTLLPKRRKYIENSGKETTCKPIPQADLPFKNPKGTNVAGGTHKFFGQPNMPGQYFGTGGCASCVAVIVKCPGGCGGVFHFTAQDNAAGTLIQYKWSKGCKAVIAGGDDETGSRQLLASVASTLRHLDIEYGISDTDHVYIGPNGEWHVRPPK
ncbi:MAG: RHS repeat-associated core domain-containing protein [Bacteroidales bacterium]|nr:RHS repeat-associated core domain-containing protein [Bacteroidales bacterium]